MLSCLLALQLLLAAPPAGGREPFRWEVPGLVSTLDVPGRMHVGGIPIRLQVYTSRERVEYLLQYFATAFDEAGFYIQRHQKRLAVQPHLTALDTRTLTAYTVILQPEPGGLTTVVLGEARMGDFKPAADTGGVPVFPGAKDVLRSDFEGAQTIAYQVEAKQAQVQAWYRERLTRAGFREEEPLLFRKKGQELQLALTPAAGRLHVLLFLRTAGDPAPLEPEQEPK